MMKVDDVVPLVRLERTTRGLGIRGLFFLPDLKLKLSNQNFDDRQFFPPYHAAPVIRGEILEDHPELVSILSALDGLLDDAAMQRLNFEVDGEKKRPAQVARGFLKSKGLL